MVRGLPPLRSLDGAPSYEFSFATLSSQLPSEDVFWGEFAFGWARGTRALHLVHGTIGSFEQGIHVFAVFGEPSGSDACGEIQHAAFEAERLIGFLGEALDDGEQDIALGYIAENDAKLVAAEAGHEVRSAGNAADTERHFAQGCVAGAVPIAVVDA